MSGITLRQILSCINRFETVKLEDECGAGAYWNEPYKMLYGALSTEQLETTFDYIRTDDGEIAIGISRMHYDLFKDLYEA